MRKSDSLDDILSYLNDNRPKHSFDILRAQLVKDGLAADLIERAIHTQRYKELHVDQQVKKQKSNNEESFRSLYAMADLYVLAAICVVIATILFVFSETISLYTLMVIVIGFISTVTLTAASSAIKAFLAIERSTRQASIEVMTVAGNTENLEEKIDLLYQSTLRLTEQLTVMVGAVNKMADNSQDINTKLESITESSRATASMLYRQQKQ